MTRAQRTREILLLIAIQCLILTLTGAVTLAASGPRMHGLASCGASLDATPALTPPPTIQSSPPANAHQPILRLLRDVPLPGEASRFDYQSFDPRTGRLYLAHMGAGQLIAFATRTDSVLGTVSGLPGVTGVLAVPEVHRIFASVTGHHNVAVIDDRTLRVVARLGPIGTPDGLAYAPSTHQVFVSDEAGGGELVIDARTNHVVTTIALGGEAGNTQYDAGSGCVLVAVQNHDQLVALDPTSDRVVGRYTLDAGCAGPHGFLIDAPAREAFVSCEDNAKLIIVKLAPFEVSGSYEVGDRPDVLAFDPGLQWLYVASEAGVVSVFAARGASLQPVSDYRAPHAHSVAVDPLTHRIYLPLENVNGQPVLRILAQTTEGGSPPLSEGEKHSTSSPEITDYDPCATDSAHC